MTNEDHRHESRDTPDNFFLDPNDSDTPPNWYFGRGICIVPPGEARRTPHRPPGLGLLGILPLGRGCFNNPPPPPRPIKEGCYPATASLAGKEDLLVLPFWDVLPQGSPSILLPLPPSLNSLLFPVPRRSHPIPRSPPYPNFPPPL